MCWWHKPNWGCMNKRRMPYRTRLASQRRSFHTFYFFAVLTLSPPKITILCASSPKYDPQYIVDTPWGQKGPKRAKNTKKTEKLLF